MLMAPSSVAPTLRPPPPPLQLTQLNVHSLYLSRTVFQWTRLPILSDAGERGCGANKKSDNIRDMSMFFSQSSFLRGKIKPRTDKRVNKIFLIYNEIQSGSVAKS
jgi:hypothetical protein